MIKNVFLVAVFILLGVAFWLAPNLQEISAGVAILLFGMVALEKGFKSFAEGPLKRLLAKATNKFYKSFTLGAISTALLQSSSLISVITISFISAGLLSLHSGLGIIYGANLGTTATAWLVAYLGLKLKISALAMPLLVFGVVLYLQMNRSLKGFGNILLGLGFFFFGIALMKSGFETFQGGIDFTSISGNSIWNQLLFIGMGIAITVILQSSSASMAIILTALASGQIDYLNTLTLAIGANVGTTITAIIGAMASGIDGKRIAFGHLVFNVVTAVIAVALIHQFVWLVDQGAEFFGISADDYAMKLAVFHTLFNLTGIMVMWPLAGKLEGWLKKWIKPSKAEDYLPLHLNDAALAYPQAAIHVMTEETKRLFELCFEAIAHGLGMSRESMLNKDIMEQEYGKVKYEVDIDNIYYNRIKLLYGEIVKFGLKAQKQSISPADAVAINNILKANRYFIETVKDVKDIQANVLKYCKGDNEVMREEYNRIRQEIASMVQVVFEFQAGRPLAKNIEKNEGASFEKISKDRNVILAYLNTLKSKDVLFNGTLNARIQEQAITSAMVTSLINDSRITYSINKHLLKATELLYFRNDTLLKKLATK